MNRPAAALILYLLACTSAYAEVLSGPEDSSGIFEVGFENDGLAPVPDSEWDDLASFGFFLNSTVSSTSNVFLHLRGITNRKENSRTDLLHIGATWNSDEIYNDPFVIRLNGGIGIEAYGNMGLSSVQHNWHSSSGIDRPVNSNYDIYSNITPLISGNITISHTSTDVISIRTAADLTMETFHSRLAAGINTGGVDISAGFEKYYTSTHSSSLINLYEMENGFFYTVAQCSGRLRYSFNAHPITGVSNGSISFVTGMSCPETLINLDFGIILGRAPSTAVQFSIPLPRVGVFDPLVSFGLSGGWSQDVSGDEAPRYTSYTLGLGLSRQLNTVISLRASALTSLAFDQLRSLNQEISEVVASRSCLEGGLSGELRFRIPKIIGIGIRGEYSVPVLVFDSYSDPFNYREPLRFQLFLTSP